jgi:hypothetical protein
MSNEIEVLVPELVGKQLADVEKTAGVAEDTALALRGQFADFYNEIVEWRGKAAMVTKPEDVTHQKIAREVRLGLRGVRCNIENTRKSLKADSLARGKAIDGFSNVLKYLCEPIEEKLLAVEQYAEHQEAARIAALVAERTSTLASEGVDPTAYNLGVMDDNTFTLVLAGIRKSKQDQIEAARKAESERIEREHAEAMERERIRKENEQLKKEAAERDAKERAERAKVEAERQAERDAAAKKQREVEAKAKAERDAREKLEREAVEAKRKEEARIAAEKAEIEAKEKSELAAKKKAARAPDKEKLKAFANSILEVPAQTMSSADGLAMMNEIVKKQNSFFAWIIQQAETL